MTLFELLIPEYNHTIVNIDSETLDLIMLLDIYGKKENLPWGYIEKNGIFRTKKRLEDIANLNPIFKEWALAYRTRKFGEIDRKDLKIEEISLSDQIDLIEKYSKDKEKELKRILSFNTSDEETVIFSKKSPSVPMMESIWKIDKDLDVMTEATGFRIRYKNFDDYNWTVTDWHSDKESFSSSVIEIRKKSHYVETQFRYPEYIKYVPRGFKLNSEYYYIKADVTFVDGEKTENDEALYEFSYKLCLTEKGKKIYEFVKDYIKSAAKENFGIIPKSAWIEN